MSKEDIKNKFVLPLTTVLLSVFTTTKKFPMMTWIFILDTAWLSPSSIGLEAWRFVVLDRKQIEKLRDELKAVAWGAQYQLDTASHFCSPHC